MKDVIEQFQLDRPASARRQLSHYLREMIVSGRMSPGSKLPSNKELASQWRVACSSVQAALATLAKEGLLERTPKLGTFVAQRTKALTHVGIYLLEDIWRMPTAAYRRSLVANLCELLRAQDIVPDIWIDPRPAEEHSTPWMELVRAAEQRRIQAILLTHGGPTSRNWIARLPIPCVEQSMDQNATCVGHEPGAPERLAVEELARQGCRSVGLISPYGRDIHAADGSELSGPSAAKIFCERARELGLMIQEAWDLHPAVVQPQSGAVSEEDSEHFGYEAMKRVLSLPERPEGMYVTHDWVARGALTAILESRTRIPEDLKLVLHRNREMKYLCSMPVSFIEHDVAALAKGMIDAMHAVLRGEEIGPVILQPVVARNEAPRRLKPALTS